MESIGDNGEKISKVPWKNFRTIINFNELKYSANDKEKLTDFLKKLEKHNE
ncbi:hypothetical protein U732_3614 [Clostridium argentinense CDC 2741]|uniref:Uncharacterized protein n=1 Tax=Clostridium argentinense CDC 2741 TaxID=1418104 RepID=A0A0C1R330_9CLOT|nr:hypothetical protein [Clostridium argentinense]KIE47922.1 hypothetical protein U732_3614 [Clostridium argentinense CDC 2741]